MCQAVMLARPVLGPSGKPRCAAGMGASTVTGTARNVTGVIRMHIGVKTVAVAAAIAVGAGVWVAGAPSGAASEAVIKERQELMSKVVSPAWRVLTAYVKDEKGTPDDVIKSAKELNAAANKIVPLFPRGTGRGDFPDKVTRALPAIWEDRQGFETSARALADQSAKLAEIAKTGDRDEINAQIAVLGKEGCTACHNGYRGAAVK